MVNLKKINKLEFGNLLIPDKIYHLDYKKELELMYQRLYFDNVNYLIILNIYLFSLIVSFISYAFLYPLIYNLFYDFFISGLMWSFIILFISFFIFHLFIYYFILIIYFIYLRTKIVKSQQNIEKDLPEFLDNLVSNLKGGISLEKAFLKSVRPDQKDLFLEVTLINEKIMMGDDVTKAIAEFRKRYLGSALVSRTIFLVLEGINGGGNLAEPLEKISYNLKKIYLLNDEIKANSGGFSVVIIVISVVIAPLLFALAITLLSFIGNLFSLLANSGGDFISVSSVPVEFSKYLIIFSYFMIILIISFSSMIVAELKNEESYEMMKYLPIYIIVSLFLYWEFSKLLLSFFGGIF